MATRKIYVDVQNSRLVESFTSPNVVSAPPPLTVGDLITLEIYFVKPAATPTALLPQEQYTIPVGATLKLALKPAEDNDFEAASYLAYIDTFIDANDGTIDGKSCDLDLNTTELVGTTKYVAATAASRSSWLEIEMTPSGGSPSTIVRWQQVLNNQVIDNATAPTVAGPTYMTAAETMAAIRGGNSSSQHFSRTTIPSGQNFLDITFSPALSSPTYHPSTAFCVSAATDGEPMVFAGLSNCTTGGCKAKFLGSPSDGQTSFILGIDLDPT